MTVLVTGGGGFVGSNIVHALLERGYRVRSLARGEYPELVAQGVEVVRGDIGDRQTVIRALEGCDAVFHVAAKAGQWGNYESYYRPNVVGTQNVIHACRVHGISKLIFTSSPSVVDGGFPIEGGDESLPYPAHYVSPYAETKAISEQMVLAANSDKLATVAIRPPLVWGVGDKHLMPRFIARAKQGRLFRIGYKAPLVDTTYIDNVVHAHLLAFERLHPQSKIAGKAYFISNDDPRPVHEMINLLVEAMGYPPAQRTVPAFLAMAVATIVEGFYRLRNSAEEPPLSRFIVQQVLKARWFNINAAKRDLGYQPLVSIEEGLEYLRQTMRK